VEISSKWERQPVSWRQCTAEIDLGAEGSLRIYSGDEWVSIKGVRSTQQTFLTHVQAREAATLLLEAIALYRDSNDMDIDEGIAAALAALREPARYRVRYPDDDAPGAVTA
jgi:hypothetical protein